MNSLPGLEEIKLKLAKKKKKKKRNVLKYEMNHDLVRGEGVFAPMFALIRVKMEAF